MIRGVICDVDGVLLDSLDIWNDIGERYVRKEGYQPVRNMNAIIAEMSMEDSALWIKETYSMNMDTSVIIQEIQDMLKEYYQSEVVIKDGALDYLKYLQEKKIPVVCATSGLETLCQYGFKRNGIETFIQKIFTEKMTGKDKHHPLIFEEARQYLHTEKSETLVVEDALYAIKTAHNAGYMTAAVEDKYDSNEEDEIRLLADYYCRNLRQLKGVIDYENSINNCRK